MSEPIIAISHDKERVSDSSDARAGVLNEKPGQPSIVFPDTVGGVATAEGVVAFAQDEVDAGHAEDPMGSNRTKYGAWWGVQDQWCAMFVSFCLAHAGFSDDEGDTCSVPGLTQTTEKGWAFVPYMRDSFAAVGRRFSTPEAGDIFCVNSHGHTGLVAEVRATSFISAEGNFGDRTDNVERSIDSCYYLRPPYSEVMPVAARLGAEFMYGRPNNQAFLFDPFGRIHTRLTSAKTLDVLRTAGVPDAGVRPDEVHRELVTIAQRGGFSG